ncbi:MAG: hypothetical protein HC879_03845 [Leptolyngbyaceae cyanobacterium SL_5_9]|nr:hypothetical protein [Leptolyngbyaceae cyanobacterium SL_5_9]
MRSGLKVAAGDRRFCKRFAGVNCAFKPILTSEKGTAIAGDLVQPPEPKEPIPTDNPNHAQ